MYCTRLAENTGRKSRQKSPSRHHRTSLSGCIFATKTCIDTGKNLLNSNILSTCPHNMANFSPLAAEIRWRVWGTPANFNGFRVLASLLQQRCSPEANRTLHDVWPSPGLVHHIYIFGSSCPWRYFVTCKIQFASKSCILVYWQRYCMALQQRASAKLCVVVQGMELLNFRMQMAPPIFGWAAIMLGVGPHCSQCCYTTLWKSKHWKM